MHRLKVDSASLENETPELSRESANHLRVVRPKDSEEIELFDGHGRWRIYRYSAADRGLVAVSAMRELPRPAVALTLFACVTKGSRWDWTVEKATELGATRIVPVISERTIVRIGRTERVVKCERWRRISEEAARQSDAKWLPEIIEPVDFADSLRLVAETSCYAGALTNPPSRPILDAVEATPGVKDLAVYVGPEGDFTPEELASLLEVAVPVSFGPTVLRAETAAIYGLSVLAAVRSRILV